MDTFLCGEIKARNITPPQAIRSWRDKRELSKGWANVRQRSRPAALRVWDLEYNCRSVCVHIEQTVTAEWKQDGPRTTQQAMRKK